MGLPLSEAFSLISDMLVLRRRALPLLPRPLWLNLTSLRGRVMALFAEEAEEAVGARKGRVKLQMGSLNMR